jgi:hypothetical protein
MKFLAIAPLMLAFLFPSCSPTPKPPRKTPGDIAVMQRRADEVAALRKVAAFLRENPSAGGPEARKMLGEGVQAASVRVSEPWMLRLNNEVGLRPGDAPDADRWDSAKAAALFEQFAAEHEATSFNGPRKTKKRR